MTNKSQIITSDGNIKKKKLLPLFMIINMKESNHLNKYIIFEVC